MGSGKRKSKELTIAAPGAGASVVEAEATDATGPFVGQWNRLVSTTNWEKGRIICQWRDALVADGAAADAYGDEAWSQLVGGVTSQHVGRLRRAFQRFGEVYDQYDGLYWSHFQAALDWEDAEMWLEGAIHNRWSVSQMRGKRWETLGKPGEAPPFDGGEEPDELSVAENQEARDGVNSDASYALTSTPTKVKPVEGAARRQTADTSDDEPMSREAAERSSAKTPAKSRSRLAVDVDDLPGDLADAFEQFKLAIIAQRRLGWSETTPEAVIECLDALRELALAPADD